MERQKDGRMDPNSWDPSGHSRRSNDRTWFDLQKFILKTSTAVMNIADICLDADNKDRLTESKEVVVKAIDAITLLGRASK